MAELDPDYLARRAKTVADLYADATAELIRIVARRLNRGITDPGWAEQKLLELLALRTEAETVIAALQGAVPTAVTDTITDAATTGARLAATEVALDTASVTRVNTTAIRALADAATNQLERTHLQLLRSTLDTYRAVIADTSAPSVVTGALTRRQATQRALDRYARRGITGFRDRAGRNWTLEAYTEMATRTAAGRAMIQGSLDTYSDAGRNFVIVSDAPEECAQCRPFEGRGLSIDGTGIGTTVGGIRIVDSVRGATSAGLFHQNCRHRVSPIVAGVTRPMRHTADPEGDRLRQRQRAIERRIRAAKRQVAAAEPFGDSPELARVRGVLARAQADMRDFAAAHNRKRLRPREQIGRAT